MKQGQVALQGLVPNVFLYIYFLETPFLFI